ncbi:MAG: hypothetical protein G01um1014106_504, partial [Parcubacteria group bacterium Gr01-1014_106]
GQRVGKEKVVLPHEDPGGNKGIECVEGSPREGGEYCYGHGRGAEDVPAERVRGDAAKKERKSEGELLNNAGGKNAREDPPHPLNRETA